jgi:hypothetical protein
MQCPQRQFENVDEAKFFNEFGSRVKLISRNVARVS